MPNTNRGYSLTDDRIEVLEKTVLYMVVQALKDYLADAVTIFEEETDQVQDIAEDVTREAIAAMGFSGTSDRLYGKVDVKKAIYAFIPRPHLVALMLDAKAEKRNGDRTATIQMSQTSMRVRMCRSGRDLDEPGKLEQVIRRGDKTLVVITIIAKFIYEEEGDSRALHKIRVACIPNGILQDKYNPEPHDTIWLAGRDAPTLGEDFRVRLSFSRLQEKAVWRVQDIPVPDQLSTSGVDRGS